MKDAIGFLLYFFVGLVLPFWLYAQTLSGNLTGVQATSSLAASALVAWLGSRMMGPGSQVARIRRK